MRVLICYMSHISLVIKNVSCDLSHFLRVKKINADDVTKTHKYDTLGFKINYMSFRLFYCLKMYCALYLDGGGHTDEVEASQKCFYCI